MVFEKYRDRSRIYQSLCFFAGLALGISVFFVCGGKINGLDTSKNSALAVSGAGTGNQGEGGVAGKVHDSSSTYNSAASAGSSASFSASDTTLQAAAGAAAESTRTPELLALWNANNDFESTMRSCFSSDCYNFSFETPGGGASSAHERIAFLAPDTRGMQSVIRLLSKAAKKDLEKELFVTLDTHVPPYGYGKNHGWTRIVRFVRRVATQAESLISTIYPEPTTEMRQLYGLQIRQLVRWHCRLSHVAAHTRMLTVFVDDLVTKPAVEIYKILSFVGHRPARTDILQAVQTLIDQTRRELGMGSDSGNWVLSEDNTSVIHNVDPALVTAGTDAFTDEMLSTQDLQAWPCKTFASLRDIPSGGPLLAKLPLKHSQLAPDCQAEYVKCSVGVDKKGG